MGEDVEVDLGTTQGPGTRCSRPVWIAVAVFSICALLTVLILAGIAIAATAYQPSGGEKNFLKFVYA